VNDSDQTFLVVGSHLEVVTEVDMATARYFSAVRFMAFIGSIGFTAFFAMSPLLAAQTIAQPADGLRTNVDSASLPDAPMPIDAVMAANDLPLPAIASFSADWKQQADQTAPAAQPKNPQQPPQQNLRTHLRVPLRRSKISVSLRNRPSLIQTRRPDWIAEHIC